MGKSKMEFNWGKLFGLGLLSAIPFLLLAFSINWLFVMFASFGMAPAIMAALSLFLAGIFFAFALKIHRGTESILMDIPIITTLLAIVAMLGYLLPEILVFSWAFPTGPAVSVLAGWLFMLAEIYLALSLTEWFGKKWKLFD